MKSIIPDEIDEHYKDLLMATQDMAMSATVVDRKLESAKQHIRAKNYRQAKMILNDLDHPTAFRWLEKIEEIEMVNENLALKAAPVSKAEPDRKRLAQVTGVFLDNGWTISTRIGETIVVEKQKAPGLLAAAVGALFGLIGMIIVLIAIANAKVERITLTEADDGTIELTGSKSLRMVVHDPQEAVKIAQSVRKGATYAATLALGIGATILWVILLT